MRVTPLFGTQYSGGGVELKRYAVRKGSLRSTQKSWYIVGMQTTICTLKRYYFHQETQ